MTATGRRKRSVVVMVVVTLALVTLLAGVRLVSLFAFATEGDVPPASSVSLPAGSELITEEKECASGGCWAVLSVRPPEGVSPQDLATSLGMTPQARQRGTLWDPRTVNLSSEADGELLVIRADYWSRQATP
ncbi:MULTISPECIES: hypothetical protein [unclassified Curtobacterium]|uniref:hypothetical protein n=1 Tax=unclassified Curtobacterium TaxID=257496 RepID=UPI0010501413|nr:MULTISPECIES: hypothetical protein [unclassified Curtobacterium]